MAYPLQNGFYTWLKQKAVAEATVANYDGTLNQFFTFLETKRGLGGADSLSAITTNDLRAYLQEKELTQATFNKKLSHLNQYFRYLVDHGIVNSYPTLALHGEAVAPQLAVSTSWLKYLPDLLNNEQLSMYTRVVLLLLGHGYHIQEIMGADFFAVFLQLDFDNPTEQTFQKRYCEWIRPLQKKQAAEELLLKQRINREHPRLSLPGLHKYLKADQVVVPFKLAPQQLHQAFIFDFITSHPNWNQRQLCDALHLDPSSLLYYQKRLNHHP